MVVTCSAVVELVYESVNLSDFAADARFVVVTEMCDVFVSDLNNLINLRSGRILASLSYSLTWVAR